MKYNIASILNLLFTIVNGNEGIPIDYDCKGWLDECEYNLKCIWPLRN